MSPKPMTLIPETHRMTPKPVTLMPESYQMIPKPMMLIPETPTPINLFFSEKITKMLYNQRPYLCNSRNSTYPDQELSEIPNLKMLPGSRP